jgi:hypothetical protein
VGTVIALLLLGGLGGGGITALALLYFLLNPEKVQIWSALLWKAISKIGVFAGFAHKRYLKYDLQGRLNLFTKKLSKKAPYLASKRVEVQWLEARDVTRHSFLREGKAVIRLRRDDPMEANFVHATYLFVSTSLLHKLKRYISPSQRQAVDLKVTTDYIRTEKPSAVSLFVDEYLHPKTQKPGSKISELLATFEKMDQSGLFYEVLLQELEFLGDKVFVGAKHKDTKIIVEVTKAIEFLERIAVRNVGEEIPMDFSGAYSAFAIRIVGKKPKLTPSGEVYVAHIKKNVPRDIETLYLLATSDNKDVIDNVCAAVEDTFEKYRTYKSMVTLTYRKGGEETPKRREQYLAILRKKGASVFRQSA